ncbi:hypothetical protein V8G54_001595 [Vigna mungo]|uniref:Uncharacterized protein n=1 Tax=Vigna mungo TaxID=3915 RepID=A0AAQ3P6L7_VIGMU
MTTRGSFIIYTFSIPRMGNESRKKIRKTKVPAMPCFFRGIILFVSLFHRPFNFTEMCFGVVNRASKDELSSSALERLKSPFMSYGKIYFWKCQFQNILLIIC